MTAAKERIQILLNGKPVEISSAETLSSLLLERKIRSEWVTVEVNGVIPQKLDYESFGLKNGDRIEFVYHMGGGSPVSCKSAKKVVVF